MRYNGRRRTAYLFVDNRAFESEVLSVPRIFRAPMRRGAVSGGVRCGLAALRSFGSVFWCVAFGFVLGVSGACCRFFRPNVQNTPVRGTSQGVYSLRSTA